MTIEERAKEIAEKANPDYRSDGFEEAIYELIMKHLTEACETAFHEGYDEGGNAAQRY